MGEFPNKETQFTSENQPEGRGRPKGSVSVMTELRHLIEREVDAVDPIDNLKKKMPLGRIIVMKLVSAGVKGDMRAIEQIFDRLEGKPNKTMAYEDGLEVSVKIIEDNNAKPKL